LWKYLETTKSVKKQYHADAQLLLPHAV